MGARFGQLGFLRENNFQWGDSHEGGTWNKLGLSWKLSHRKVCQGQSELNQAWLLTEQVGGTSVCITVLCFLFTLDCISTHKRLEALPSGTCL